tara:strand:- start:2485 stop:3816 length:1332 start_codon:yes stop_codon:yes gene_type:complete
MIEIIEYIDTSFYKNDDIKNLKLTNKYINNLKEFDPIKIDENRVIKSYKYDLLDIFKYIDPLFWEEGDITNPDDGLYEIFGHGIMNDIGDCCKMIYGKTDKIFYEAQETNFRYTDNGKYYTGGDILIYFEFWERTHWDFVLPHLSLQVPNKESYDYEKTVCQYLTWHQKYIKFGGEIIIIKDGGEIDYKIPIREYYVWGCDNIYAILYEKYLLKELKWSAKDKYQVFGAELRMKYKNKENKDFYQQKYMFTSGRGIGRGNKFYIPYIKNREGQIVHEHQGEDGEGEMGELSEDDHYVCMHLERAYGYDDGFNTFEEIFGWNFTQYQTNKLDLNDKKIDVVELNITIKRLKGNRRKNYQIPHEFRAIGPRRFPGVGGVDDIFCLKSTYMVHEDKSRPKQPKFKTEAQKRKWLQKINKNHWLLNSKNEYIYQGDFWKLGGRRERY